ncbi:MAG: hypothetical protein Q4G07_02720 [Oscillospiraceae bacterium]|nr:hypothetical protein [Oscillospiraceae bacterium]
MAWYQIIFVFVTLLGGGGCAYQIFRMAQLDASCRGLKHPGFWGLFAANGQNGGLLLYLLGRKNYPLTISEEEKRTMQSRKKKAAVGLVFIVLGAVGLIVTVIYL